MPGRAGCPCPCAVPRCVTAALPCRERCSPAEMDGVSSNRNMSYSRWSYNRYRLSWLGLFSCLGSLFSCFPVVFVFVFFLRDAVKASHSVYINRDGEPSSGKQNPFPMLLFQSWDTVCSQQLRQRRLLMFSRCWSGKQDGSFTPGWPDRACSQP